MPNELHLSLFPGLNLNRDEAGHWSVNLGFPQASPPPADICRDPKPALDLLAHLSPSVNLSASSLFSNRFPDIFPLGRLDRQLRDIATALENAPEGEADSLRARSTFLTQVREAAGTLEGLRFRSDALNGRVARAREQMLIGAIDGDEEMFQRGRRAGELLVRFQDLETRHAQVTEWVARQYPLTSSVPFQLNYSRSNPELADYFPPAGALEGARILHPLEPSLEEMGRLEIVAAYAQLKSSQDPEDQAAARAGEVLVRNAPLDALRIRLVTEGGTDEEFETLVNDLSGRYTDPHSARFICKTQEVQNARLEANAGYRQRREAQNHIDGLATGGSEENTRRALARLIDTFASGSAGERHILSDRLAAITPGAPENAGAYRRLLEEVDTASLRIAVAERIRNYQQVLPLIRASDRILNGALPEAASNFEGVIHLYEQVQTEIGEGRLNEARERFVILERACLHGRLQQQYEAAQGVNLAASVGIVMAAATGAGLATDMIAPSLGRSFLSATALFTANTAAFTGLHRAFTERLTGEASRQSFVGEMAINALTFGILGGSQALFGRLTQRVGLTATDNLVHGALRATGSFATEVAAFGVSDLAVREIESARSREFHPLDVATNTLGNGWSERIGNAAAFRVAGAVTNEITNPLRMMVRDFSAERWNQAVNFAIRRWVLPLGRPLLGVAVGAAGDVPVGRAADSETEIIASNDARPLRDGPVTEFRSIARFLLRCLNDPSVDSEQVRPALDYLWDTFQEGALHQELHQGLIPQLMSQAPHWFTNSEVADTVADRMAASPDPSTEGQGRLVNDARLIARALRLAPGTVSGEDVSQMIGRVDQFMTEPNRRIEALSALGRAIRLSDLRPWLTALFRTPVTPGRMVRLFTTDPNVPQGPADTVHPEFLSSLSFNSNLVPFFEWLAEPAGYAGGQTNNELLRVTAGHANQRETLFAEPGQVDQAVQDIRNRRIDGLTGLLSRFFRSQGEAPLATPEPLRGVAPDRTPVRGSFAFVPTLGMAEGVRNFFENHPSAVTVACVAAIAAGAATIFYGAYRLGAEQAARGRTPGERPINDLAEAPGGVAMDETLPDPAQEGELATGQLTPEEQQAAMDRNAQLSIRIGDTGLSRRNNTEVDALWRDLVLQSSKRDSGVISMNSTPANGTFSRVNMAVEEARSEDFMRWLDERIPQHGLTVVRLLPDGYVVQNRTGARLEIRIDRR